MRILSISRLSLLVLFLSIAGISTFGLHYALAQSGGKVLDLNSSVSFPVDI
ncbi:hypothetical protein NBZ79_02820 [Sneathiella marina]|uniref:Uncharacterized protein n=1 Tax=Sneathiella marina TaxID=2950108 RepID=A0ABY4W3Y7_9PROT|nr:hypothetical protein [Sneathiella marina]USG61905.1 hypothetical protein NBZ79_02820 [Sneathiella marina]